MYKKIAVLSILFRTTVFCALTQHACNLTPWIEIKPSYFFFVTSPMKEVYDHGGFEIQGSASIPVCKYLDFYGSVGYRKIKGHALNTCEKTSLTVIPVDIGLKPIFNFCERFYYFFAIGPRYFHLRQCNDSPYVSPKITGNGIGFFVNTGFNVLLADHLLLGVFGEYSYEKKTICPTRPNVYSNGSMQMGGLAFGVNVGYAF